jgi:hypothetical protein
MPDTRRQRHSPPGSLRIFNGALRSSSTKDGTVRKRAQLETAFDARAEKFLDAGEGRHRAPADRPGWRRAALPTSSR